MPKAPQQGFTLIEMSIVLVIIGLIVGGVLVGQDLIRAAAARTQISQIEKYDTAVNTFRGKYDALPGDMNAASATQFGFVARGVNAGQGDGNGVLEGANGASGSDGALEGAGETPVFWVDLSTAILVDGNFNTATETVWPSGVTGSALNAWFPQAKLGGGNYVYVFSNNCINYFGLSAVTNLVLVMTSNPGLTVQQAYSIDKKMDDGLPQSGNVLAGYVTPGGTAWANQGGFFGQPNMSAVAGSSTTCMDNGNVGGPQQYSLTQNGGAGVNCALSFQFQ